MPYFLRIKSNKNPLLLRHNIPVVLSNEATSMSPSRNTEWNSLNTVLAY